MKSAKKMVLTAVILSLTLGAAGAFAYGGKDQQKGPRDECGPGMDRGIMRQMNLTDAQKDQLQSFRDANRAEMRGKNSADRDARLAERQAYHAKMQALVLADNFDEVQAAALAKEMVEKQTERRVEMLKRKHQMLSVLTPEQKAEFVKLQNERMQQCDNRMQKRMSKQNSN
ncbi:MAG: CpxP family protein [Vibrionaceae bacterium]|nr:CpxP family protein [Vibrionaceae bacterium]